MSGGLFVTALRREVGEELDDESLVRLPALHAEAYLRHYGGVRPLAGAGALLSGLTEMGIPWAIATSGSERTAGRARALLGLSEDIPMVTRDQVQYAKPDPDLFLTAAAGIGLLSGGYGREELIYAGAFRVYEDPGDLLAHLDEVGVRRPA